MTENEKDEEEPRLLGGGGYPRLMGGPGPFSQPSNFLNKKRSTHVRAWQEIFDSVDLWIYDADQLVDSIPD